MRRNNRSQAALEFLTTYGWAFIVILTMISALSYFGVLSPGQFISDRCVLGAPFVCDSNSFIVGEGGAKISVRSGLNENLVIENLRYKVGDELKDCLGFSVIEVKGSSEVILECLFQEEDFTAADSNSNVELSVTYRSARDISGEFKRDAVGDIKARAHEDVEFDLLKNKNSLFLDGDTQHALSTSLGDFGSQNFGNEFSIDFWFKTNNTEDFMMFSAMLNEGIGTGFQLAFNINTMYMLSPGSVYFEYRGDSGVHARASNTNTGLADDEWHHLALSVNEGSYSIFVDGSPLSLASYASGTPSSFSNFEHDIGIGVLNWFNPPIRSFDGFLDEFRIWNKSLNQTEVQDFMGEVNVFNHPNLVTFYRFENEDINWDSSGNKNHGTYVGNNLLRNDTPFE